MSETYAAIGGISETAARAKSSLARIFIVIYGRAGLRFWMLEPVRFYNEIHSLVS